MQMHRQIGTERLPRRCARFAAGPGCDSCGEIPRPGDGRIAVEAALTGHLLLSTMHTNDAPSAVARMTDMGVEPFMISLRCCAFCAQRLMRRVCKNCRQNGGAEGREKELIEKAIGWSGPIFKHKSDAARGAIGVDTRAAWAIHELWRSTRN